MDRIEEITASYLLKIKAVKLQPKDPFTWASGWKSPIYCDNRKTLSFPEIRKFIKEEFAAKVRSKYPEAEVVAGVATGAIAHGALVAEELNLPFIYVRPSAKGHGLGNQIEGVYRKGNKVVVIEDLISTGSSSLGAVKALREEGCDVLGMLAIFTYGFAEAAENFAKANCELETLGNYNSLVDMAVKEGYIHENELETLRTWRKSPGIWGM